MKRYLSCAAILAATLLSCSNGSSRSDKLTAVAEDAPLNGYADTLRSDIESLAESGDVRKVLCQQWLHADDKEDAKYSGSSNKVIEIVFRGFAFFDDGTVLQNPRGQLYIGTWTYNEAEKTITIKQERGGTEKYRIHAVAADELVLSRADEAYAGRHTYVGEGIRHKTNSNDPFYPANNAWRVKPLKKETDEEIARRAKDYVKFCLLFYNDNLVRDSATISFAGFPACYKWYAGGITIPAPQNLDESWFRCFYNREQALQAHALLEKLVTQKYQWTRGENWVIKNARVLKQMYDRF